MRYTSSRSGTAQALQVISTGESTSPTFPSTLQNPSLLLSNSLQSNTTAQFPAIIPLSASPMYTQQPTYVNRSIRNPIQTAYTPLPPPQEEVCIECQDMADVNVTSPGVWESASDAAFEELKQRELDDEANGIITAVLQCQVVLKHHQCLRQLFIAAPPFLVIGSARAWLTANSEHLH
jgi:hypothetical protein